MTVEGMRVVVTRAATQSDELIDAIDRAGGQVVAAPMVEVAPPADGGLAVAEAIGGLGPADWLAVLSSNAARSIVAAVPEPRRCRLAVLGKSTGAPLAEAGWQIDVVARVPTAEGLLADMLDCEPAGRCVLVQAENGRPDLAHGLRARGWRVDVVIGYRNMAPEIDPAIIEEARGADIVVFASPSAVERYCDLLGPEPPVAACIGPTTEQAARSAGFTTVTASEPTVPSLVETINAALIG